jgi:hypothetical protein
MHGKTRSSTRRLVIQYLRDAAMKQHAENYQRLYVQTDGSLHWAPSLESSGTGLCPGEMCILTVGRGADQCSCDYCKNEGPETLQEAIEEAVELGQLKDLEWRMLAAFDGISNGYFDDERRGEVGV